MEAYAKPLILLPFGFVALAISFVIVGSKLEKRFGETPVMICAYGAIVCCYGFCSFIAFAILAGIFHLQIWLAITIAVPLGLPVLYLLGKSGE